MNISEANRKRLLLVKERAEALLAGKDVQQAAGGAWVDFKGWSEEHEISLEWLCSKFCRIKPTPKTIPLSLETWPPGLVQVKEKASGSLVTINEVGRTAVEMGSCLISFNSLAESYTHPDGRPLTIEVEG